MKMTTLEHLQRSNQPQAAMRQSMRALFWGMVAVVLPLLAIIGHAYVSHH